MTLFAASRYGIIDARTFANLRSKKHQKLPRDCPRSQKAAAEKQDKLTRTVASRRAEPRPLVAFVQRAAHSTSLVATVPYQAKEVKFFQSIQ